PNTKKSRCKIQRDFFVQGSEKGEQFNRTDSHIKIAEPPPVRYKNNRADAAPNLLGHPRQRNLFYTTIAERRTGFRG
uniref:hypothetical protein n=1 Tax=Alistipes putredinis TaxID=28117 RepID=UPI003FD6C4CC